jgi:hypothetical protein
VLYRCCSRQANHGFEPSVALARRSSHSAIDFSHFRATELMVLLRKIVARDRERSMGNETAPIETSSWSDVLQELNIPKLIAGPAGEAISRLVGYLVDVPSEYVKSFKQGIADKREARSAVSKALATAVASEVVADKDLVRRATQSFLAKELRAQTNKEAVARIAIEHLSREDETHGKKPQTPEEDWLNVFEQYAENASSEKLRDLWGRVLAKEIRSPKSFSLRTMRFVSELDVYVAQTFQKHAKSVIEGVHT